MRKPLNGLKPLPRQIMTNPYPPNVQVELARERNHLAAARSLLSFVRTSLILISAGVGINEVVQALSPEAPGAMEWARILSLITIGLGVVNLILAIVDYRGEMQRLQQPEYRFTPRWSLGGTTGFMLFALGLTIVGLMATRIWN